MWHKGQQYRGRLVEEQEPHGHWLVSIDGKLIVVKNDSGLAFKKDQFVVLEVKTEKPLSFHVIGKAHRKDRHINVRI